MACIASSHKPRLSRSDCCLQMSALRCGLPSGTLGASLTGSFYGDSFVKTFLVVRAAMFARLSVWLDQSI
jgi:hypothetical protein